MSESGGPHFQPTVKVPFKENQSYGWIILLKTKKKRIKWREELELPVARKRGTMLKSREDELSQKTDGSQSPKSK